MAIAVRGWYKNDYTSTSNPNSTSGVAWENGDMIVVCMALSDGSSADISAPTNANLTFTQRELITNTSGQECEFSIHTAPATSTESSQTITAGYSAGTKVVTQGVWVLSGADDYVASGNGRDENGFSYNPSSGSCMIYFAGDWNTGNSGRVGETNSGTLTERADEDDGTWIGVWAGEWVEVDAGTDTWGITSYSGWRVTHGYVEISASAAAAGGIVTPRLKAAHRHALVR